jgi:aspartyl-tRNA(Asn)/glutamyl-tRNA(Gln) amidotransferase subunit A
MHTKTLKSCPHSAKQSDFRHRTGHQFLDRIEQSDLNAFLHVDRALTLAQPPKPMRASPPARHAR